MPVLTYKIRRRPHWSCEHPRDPRFMLGIVAGVHNDVHTRRSAFTLFEKCGEARSAVIAYRGEEIVGILRIRRDRGMLRDSGAWVAPRWRRRGIAKSMFGVLLGRRGLIATTVSRCGHALIRSEARRRHVIEREKWA